MTPVEPRKKPSYFPSNPGGLIGILIVIYEVIPVYNWIMLHPQEIPLNNHQGPLKTSLLSWPQLNGPMAPNGPEAPSVFLDVVLSTWHGLDFHSRRRLVMS